MKNANIHFDPPKLLNIDFYYKQFSDESVAALNITFQLPKGLYGPLKTYIPVYSASLDKGLSTRKPVEWQRLTPHAEVQVRDYLSIGKYYLLTIIKLQVYYPLGPPALI